MPPRKPRPRVDEPPRGAPRGRDERGALCVIIYYSYHYTVYVYYIILYYYCFFC